MKTRRRLELVKRTFSLTAPSFDWLRRESSRLGVTVSELVRRAIDEKRERAIRNDR